MNRQLLTILFLAVFQLSGVSEVYAQQPVFSQFYNAGIYLNPALAGLERDPMIGLNFRSQWAAADIPFTTFQFSFVHPFIKPGGRSRHTGSVGLSLVSDVTGSGNEFKQLGGLVTGAYNLHLNEYGSHLITFAFQGGFYQKTVDPGSLQWSSQYNALIGYDPDASNGAYTTQENKIYPVMTIGLLWSMRNKDTFSRKDYSFYNGISISNFNRPDVSLFQEGTYSLPVTYKLHGGMNIYINKRYSVSPTYLFQFENDRIQSNAGAFFTYYLTDRIRKTSSTLLAGGWYRWGDSFIFAAGFEYNSLRVVFSYDQNINSLSRYFGGASAYEIGVQWRMNKSGGMRRYGTPMI